MTRWALWQVRRSMYAPLELAADYGWVPPEWVVRAVVALDQPLVRHLMGCRGRRP